MIRECNLEEISDGKRLSSKDLAKVGCNDCKGCHDCCSGMEDTICLDPYDVCMLTHALQKGFDRLMAKEVGLHVEAGVIIPHLQMNEAGVCHFLNGEGRCSVHSSRPGICRLFPLGRVYENDTFYYFLQSGECPYPNRTKEKIKNWLGIPELGCYEEYILMWHDHIKSVQKVVAKEELAKEANLFHLQLFFLTGYTGMEHFYTEIKERLQQWDAKYGGLYE